MSATAVLVDATALGEAAGQRGVGTYVRGVLGALGTRADLRIRAVGPGSGLPAGIEEIPVHRYAPGRWRHHERDLRLSFDLHRHARGAVVHSLDTEPPWRPPRPFVQTLFDVIPLVVHDPALAESRQRWQALTARFQSADAVIAISHHAARTGIAELGLDPGRVEVAPLGVDAAFSPDGPVHHEPDDVPYVLLVAEFARRKGFAEAFAVIGALAARGLPHRLVVAGRQAPWVIDRLQALITSAPDPGRIRVAGYVKDLPALYRGAAATIVTSRAEGFGLPVVESMASGTPVVSFDNTSLPEVVGDGGVLVPDGDVLAFTAEVAHIVTDDRRRQELVAAGTEWAARFSWEACAAVHADLYHRLAPR